MSGTDVRDRCQGPVSGTDVDVGAPRRPGPGRGGGGEMRFITQDDRTRHLRVFLCSYMMMFFLRM